VKKGRGFMKANREWSALHGWQAEDYDENQKRLS
jgi:hypothetical protein